LQYQSRETDTMGGAEPPGLSQLSDEQIGHLVDGLNSLVEGEAAASMLVRCGSKAVPAVTKFLIHGRPASVAEPRRRAVRVLADLGAVDSLIAYLEHERQIEDAILRFSEEGVESLAAELLARWPTGRVFNSLINLAKRRKLIGLCVAFGQLRKPEAVPLLIRDLGDGLCSRAAEDALLQIGRVAIPALNSAATLRELNGETEVPSSIQRRRFAVRLLRATGLGKQDWTLIRRLIHDSDSEIAAYTCIAGLPLASQAERILLASRMLRVAGGVNWFVQSEIQEALLANYQSLGWVVQQYVSASVHNTSEPSRRLALSVISAANSGHTEPQVASHQRTWFSRVRGILRRAWQSRKSDG
jgi:hypothetical protein